MKNSYIIVLKNKHLIFSNKLPTKRGNFTKEVTLFKTSNSTNCSDILKWTSNDFNHENFNEVTNWE